MGIVDSIFSGSLWEGMLKAAKPEIPARLLGEGVSAAAGGVISVAGGALDIGAYAQEVVDAVRRGVPIGDALRHSAYRMGVSGEKVNKLLQEKTGIPFHHASDPSLPGVEQARMIGTLVTLARSRGAKATGAAAGAAAPMIDREQNPTTRALIEAIPAAVDLGGAAGRSIRGRTTGGMANEPQIETTVPMSKGRANLDAKMLAREEKLARDPKYATRAAEKERMYAAEAQKELKKFEDSIKGDPSPQAGKKAYDRFDQYITSLENRRKVKGTQLYDSALKEAAQAGARVDVSGVRAKINQLIAEYETGMDSTSKQIASHLKTELQHLDEAIGAVNDMADVHSVHRTIKSIRGQLERVSKGADINTSTVETVQKALNGAYTEALTNAASNHPSVRKLMAADEFYRTSTNKIRTLEESAVGKLFERGEMGTRMRLEPEAIMQNLSKMEPTVRDFYIRTMRRVDPTLLNDLRKYKINELIRNGEVPGADAFQPGWDAKKFLSGLPTSEKLQQTAAWLFPDFDERTAFMKRVEDLRKQAATLSSDAPRVNVPAIAGGAQLATGKAGSGMIARGLEKAGEHWFTDREALFGYLYEGKLAPKQAGPAIAAAAAQGVGIANRQGEVNRKEEDEYLDSLLKEYSTGGPEAPQSPSEGQGKGVVPPQPSQSPVGPSSGLPEALQDGGEGSVDRKVVKGVDLNPVLAAVSKFESGGNPKAIGPKIPGRTDRAVGEYQLMGATADELGVNRHNPQQNRIGAETYLTQLMAKYEGSLPMALAAYNWGPGNLDEKGIENAPAATKEYVTKIMRELGFDV